MRPIKLVMNAFGPYVEKTTIDFTDFDATSLFLISGPTGSGKTMIFDAITLALYGNVSGGNREVKSIKSDHAPLDELCYVELTFEVNGKHYFIRREPAQDTGAKNERPHKVSLEKPDNTATTKVNEVKDEIEDIIGLELNQFTQIMMLPQGEFQKILLAKSDEKGKIFRELFSTEHLLKFEENLKARVRAAKEEVEAVRATIDHTLESIRVSEGDAQLQEAISQKSLPEVLELLDEKITADCKNTDQVSGQISKREKSKKEIENILEKLAENKRLKDQLQAFEQEKDHIKGLEQQLAMHEKAEKLRTPKDSLIEVQNKLAKTREDKDTTAKRLEGLQPQLKEMKEQAQSAQKDYDSLNEKRSKQTELRDQVKNFEKINANQKRMDQLQKDLKIDEENAKELTAQVENLEKDRLQLTQKQSQLGPWRKEREEARESILGIQKQISELEQKIERINTIQTKQEAAKKLNRDYKAAEENHHKQADYYKHVSQQYYADLAGILAEELVEENPCPVCGSIHHPNPAGHSDEEISKETLDQETEKLNTLKTKMDTAWNLYTSKVEEIDRDLETLNLRADKLKKTKEEDSEQHSTLQKEEKDLENKVKELNDNLSFEDKWTKELADLDQKAKDLQVEKTQVEKNQEVKQSDLKRLTAESEELQNSLTHTDENKAKADLEKLTHIIEKIEKDYQEVSKKLQDLQSKVNRESTSLDHLTKQVESLVQESTKKEETFNNALKESELEADFNKYLLDSDSKDNFKNQVDTYNKNRYHTEISLKENQDALDKLGELEEVSVYKELIEQTDAELAELKTKEKSLSTVLEINQGALNKLKDVQDKNQESINRLEQLNDLSSFASGNSQTEHASFERYVLGVYFDQVLAAGNRRLMEMSAGRYRMERQTEKTQDRGKQGLDINIFDKYTGKKRSANSLSGGETFKASLSLALGLSDVIQSQSGGIEVNTLFIDEGFGTLDQESLESAINTLVELNQGGRLVGIISHVEELKTRIINQVIIQSSPNGSKVAVRSDN